MGGVAAYDLAKDFNIPALLLMPAFSERYVTLNRPVNHNPIMMAMLGTEDKVINKQKNYGIGHFISN